MRFAHARTVGFGQRRGGRATGRLLVLVALCSLVGVVTGYAVAGGLRLPVPDDVANEPVQSGLAIPVAAGATPGGIPWTVTAFDTDRGLCLHLEGVTRENLGGGGCGFDVPSDHAISVVESRFEQPGVTAMYGPASSAVETVVLKMDDGSSKRVDVVSSPPGVSFDGGFFATVVAGAVEVEEVEARDSDGAVIERRVE